MKTEYDFSQARKNPYAKKLKQQITINIDRESHILRDCEKKSVNLIN